MLISEFLQVLSFNPQLTAALRDYLLLYQQTKQQHVEQQAILHEMNQYFTSNPSPSQLCMHDNVMPETQLCNLFSSQSECEKSISTTTCNNLFACDVSTGSSSSSPIGVVYSSPQSNYSSNDYTQPASFDDQTLLSNTFNIKGKEYCLVEKSEYEFLTENCLSRALDTSNNENDRKSSSQPSKKRKKVSRVKNQYQVKGNENIILVMEGTSSFHTESDVYFLDLQLKSQIKFKLLKGFVQGVEKVCVNNNNEYQSSLKIGSQKTFNSKSAVTYQLVFELENLKNVEWTIVTEWKGYANKSFKSLDIASSTVEIVNKI